MNPVTNILVTGKKGVCNGVKKNNKFKPPVKFITVIIIIFLVLFFIISYIWSIVSTSDYFKVTDIVTKVPNIVDLSYLKGRNIFSIDLRRESDYILDFCPDFSKVRLAKVLPNRIFVDFIKRKPVAFVRLYKYYFVDENAVLFYSSSEPQDLDLPTIAGLETKIFGVKPRKKYNIRELLLALNIIKETKNNKILKGYKIKKIDVANPSNTSVFITLPSSPADYSNGKQVLVPEYLEIRIGEDDIKNRIVFLGGVVAESNKNLSNIKYIDLRFKDPVVKFKDAK